MFPWDEKNPVLLENALFPSSEELIVNSLLECSHLQDVTEIPATFS